MCILVRHWRAVHTKVVQLVLDLWRESLRKPALIYVLTTKAQISLHVCAGWSAPLLFAIARFFSTKKRLTNLNGEQNDTRNLLVFHRICHFRAIQPFDSNWKELVFSLFFTKTYVVGSQVLQPYRFLNKNRLSPEQNTTWKTTFTFSDLWCVLYFQRQSFWHLFYYTATGISAV